MKKLSILRHKLIQETKKLIDDDEVEIGEIEKDSQNDGGNSSNKEHLNTHSSSFSIKQQHQHKIENGETKSSNKQQTIKSLKNIPNFVNGKQREGGDDLLHLQKTTLRKHKIPGLAQPTKSKNQTQSQLNLHNTLMDIQQEYLNFEMKRAQNEYAIDLDMIQEDFANQQEMNQPQIELQKKKKSQFINLLKKCKICSDSDLHYATKPFKLMKKLKDIRIMFERKSNNLEQQMKKNNMNKNKIIEDIKADKVIIRKALPEMAKNYLSEIQQKKRMNKLLQEKNEQKEQKQQQSLKIFDQSGSILINSNIDKSRLRLPLSKLASQEPTVILENSGEFKNASTTRNDFRYKSTSPFRKNKSHLFHQEAKTSRNTPMSDFNSFHDLNQNLGLNDRFNITQSFKKGNNYPQQNGQQQDKNVIPISYISEYGSCVSQDNSPYIKPFDALQKSPTFQISQFNVNQKQLDSSNNNNANTKQPQLNINQLGNQSFNHQIQNISPINLDTQTISTINHNLTTNGNYIQNSLKPSFNSFSSIHLYSANDLKGNPRNSQIDYNSVNSLQFLPNHIEQSKSNNVSGNYHRYSKSEFGNNNNPISIEKLQYLLYLQSQQEKQQKDSKQLEQNQNRMSFTTTYNKSNTSLSTTTKTNLHGLNTDRNQSLKSDYILIQSPSTTRISHQRANSYLQQGSIETPLISQKSPINGFSQNFGNFTDRNSMKSPKQVNINLLKNSNSPKKKKNKEGILENVYKFDEDQYFKHQQIYKFEQEQAQILTIKRNQTNSHSKQKGDDNSKNNKIKEHKKNESYFHDEYSSNDDSIPSATEAQLDNYYEESRKIQKKVLKLKKGDIQTKIKSLLRMENINNEINKLVQWKMKK